MRNFKFKAWVKTEKRMIETDNLLDIDYENGVVMTQQVYFENGLPVDRDLDNFVFEEIELMQATGLFDKKGVEIFDGDILANLDESGDELVYLYVIYKDGKFMAVENEEHGYSADLIDCTTYHSVVGNIYENEDLLKGTKEDIATVEELEVKALYDEERGRWVIGSDEETVEKMNVFLSKHDLEVFELWLGYFEDCMSDELFAFINILETIENGEIKLYDGSKIKLVEG